MTIRRRFILVFGMFSVALAVIFGWVSYGIASRSLETQLDQSLILTAGAAAEVGLSSSIVLSLEPGSGFEEDLAFQAYAASLDRMRRYVSGAWIFRASDRTALVTYAGDSIPIGTPLRFLDLYQVEITDALRTGESVTSLFTDDDGRRFKYGFKQLEQSDAILAVQIPADFLAPLSRLKNLLILGTLIGLLVSISLGWALAGSIAHPLERLSRAALRIQRGHMDRPVSLPRADELGMLADAMERMRGGIVKRDEQLRLMLAQVAHEIRNPLGGLDLFASAASDEEDPAERARIMRRIRDEVKALNHIITEFLTFARPMRVDADLADVRLAVEAAVFLAASDKGSVAVEFPDTPLMARIDPDQVKRMILNLIRNAQQVAEHVVVIAGMEHGEITISVLDDGPGVSPDLRDRIFEPFVTDKEQGAGLGLAIVKRVAEAHAGRVELLPQPSDRFGKGAEFRVYFPGLEDLMVPPPSEVPA